MNSAIRVLVADDSRSIRTHLRRRLSEEGFKVTLASDGAIAIEEIRKSPPDVAILDINMPNVDGYGVCEEMQRSGATFPVVFLTSVRANAVRMLGDAMGGAYLTKPVSAEKLVKTVREVLTASTA